MKKNWNVLTLICSLMTALVVTSIGFSESDLSGSVPVALKEKPAAAMPTGLKNNDGFDGTIILGRPTAQSMTASVTANQSMQIYLTWGEKQGAYEHKSGVMTADTGKPKRIVMDGLKSNTQYHYMLMFKKSGESAYNSTPDYRFQTPRSEGQSYSFVVQSDSHLKNKADRELYFQSMKTMASMKPDFIFDLGDTFLNDQDNDPQKVSFETIRKTSAEQLPYFDVVTRQAALFLAIGNHEGEYGYYLDGSNRNMAAFSTIARTLYYPNPVPNNFYSGNTQSESGIGQPQNYYAFTWGDALYVAIDPYRYSQGDPKSMKDGWQWTLGKTQYDWLRKTLEGSDAKYKFVFSHHAIGNIRGGLEIAKLYEWGGYDRNGQYLFNQKRPGWGKPIQQLMKDTGVTIFFQGHDHLFAREVVDGVVYQTLPKPAEKVADAQNNFASYSEADALLNSGFLKIDVTSSQVKVDYYRNYLVSSEPQTGNTGVVYSYTVDAAHHVKVLKEQKDDLSKYGSGVAPKKQPKDSKQKNREEGTANPVNVAPQMVPQGAASGVLLGAPTDRSIEAKAIANKNLSYYYEYGLSGGSVSKTEPLTVKSGEMMMGKMTGLKADAAYTFKMMVREVGAESYTVAQAGGFHTQRSSNDAFSFTVQADSHRDENSDLSIYSAALKNILSEQPDFHVDLGDTFMGEKLGQTEQGVQRRYLEDRGFFESIGAKVPLFLVNGNHEGENGWSAGGKDEYLPEWALSNRLKYYVNPEPGAFFSGSMAGKGNYYAFNWGDALFVTLDPFWFSQQKPRNDEEGWNYTLGKAQYDWLKKTLESSHAKYKFVFVHNLVGGYGKDARGGAEASKFFEWGGYNAAGVYEFDKKRSGWGKPIHQLLLENKVSVVFHGHDHFYAKQERDGIIYQLVPQPSHPGSEVRAASEYSYKQGTLLPSSGHIKVEVTKEKATLSYISASNSSDNGKIKAVYSVMPDGR